MEKIHSLAAFRNKSFHYSLVKGKWVGIIAFLLFLLEKKGCLINVFQSREVLKLSSFFWMHFFRKVEGDAKVLSHPWCPIITDQRRFGNPIPHLQEIVTRRKNQFFFGKFDFESSLFGCFPRKAKHFGPFSPFSCREREGYHATKRKRSCFFLTPATDSIAVNPFQRSRTERIFFLSFLLFCHHVKRE